MPILPLEGAPGPIPHGVMAADAFWLILALAIGSAIVDWLSKRRQKAAEEVEPLPPPVRPGTRDPVPPRAEKRPLSRWEEELQKLLKELPVETPPAPPAPPPLPPPVVFPTPRPSPASSPTRVPPVESAPPRPPVRPRVSEESEAPTRPLAPLLVSQAAMDRASNLHEEVARQLRSVDERTAQHLAEPVRLRISSTSPEARAAVSLIRNPATVRQAIVASLILGPPKGLASD